LTSVFDAVGWVAWVRWSVALVTLSLYVCLCSKGSYQHQTR